MKYFYISIINLSNNKFSLNGTIGQAQKEIFKALIPNCKINKKTQLTLNGNNQQILKYYNSNNKRIKIANTDKSYYKNLLKNM